MPKALKLRTSFAISGFEWNVVAINKLQKISSFEIRCLKGHLPSVENIVAFQFFAEIPGVFVWQ